jgi:hypothetical protein
MEPFLMSAAANKNVEFRIISNLPRLPWHCCLASPIKAASTTELIPESTIPNVQLIHLTLPQLNGVLFTALDMNRSAPITLSSAYKLVDFKPMFGFLFPNIVKSFDFWGHIDMDTILSDLRGQNFITDKLLRANDLVTATNGMCNGPLMLFRNRPAVNSLFKVSADLSLVVNTSRNLGFSENHGTLNAPFPKVMMKAIIKGKMRWNRTTNMYLEDRLYRKYGALKGHVWSPKYHLRLLWNTSGLYERRANHPDTRVSGFFHLISWKYLPSFQPVLSSALLARALGSDKEEKGGEASQSHHGSSVRSRGAGVLVDCHGFTVLSDASELERSSFLPCRFERKGRYSSHFFHKGKEPACAGGYDSFDYVTKILATRRKGRRRRRQRQTDKRNLLLQPSLPDGVAHSDIA